MKKFKFKDSFLTPVFAGLLIVLLASCGGGGNKPDDYITFGRAWGHVSQSFSYWLWIIVTGVSLAVMIWGHVKEKWLPTLPAYFIVVGLFLASIFARPAEVAANTKVEQAERGVYIGY